MGGGGLALAILAAGAAQPASTLAFRPAAVVDGPTVALGEVADLSGLPPDLRRSAAGLTVVRSPRSGVAVVVSSRALAERARGLMPALAPWTRDIAEAPVRLVRPADSRTAAPSPACLRLVRAVRAGTVVVAADVEPAPCEAGRMQRLRWDRAARAPRAAADLQAGDQIRAAAGVLPVVRAGDRLVLQVRIGPVLVEREVEAVRPARAGEKVFVRGADGAAFAAPTPERPS